MRPHTARRTVERLRTQREDILRVAAQHGASNVRVFGSVARGEDDDKSDIDLLVDIAVRDSEGGFAYFGRLEDLRRALADLLGREVDVMDSAGLKESNLTTPRLRKIRDRVLSEAISL